MRAPLSRTAAISALLTAMLASRITMGEPCLAVSGTAGNCKDRRRDWAGARRHLSFDGSNSTAPSFCSEGEATMC
jgi:hypothetical protein